MQSNDWVETIASVDNPVTLIADRNGNVIGNSQALAIEVLTLRLELHRLTIRWTNWAKDVAKVALAGVDQITQPPAQEKRLPPEAHLTDKIPPGTI